jgi:hypothetical protein
MLHMMLSAPMYLRHKSVRRLVAKQRSHRSLAICFSSVEKSPRCRAHNYLLLHDRPIALEIQIEIIG